jgi:coenzyme F420-reducing hydrogenase gamma subunit
MEPVQFSGNKKLVVGWFSFTCCEDSTILLTELLNDHLDEWKKLVEFKYIRPLKSKNDMTNLDVAFIEGAASSEKQEEEMKKIRSNAKYVVAIGACAVTGLPSATRNQFTEEDIALNEKIQWYLKTFNYGQKVKKLDEVIKVDDIVPGCPMNAEMFQTMLTKYLKFFGIVA